VKLLYNIIKLLNESIELLKIGYKDIKL